MKIIKIKYCLFCLQLFMVLQVAAQTPAKTIPDFTFYKMGTNHPFTQNDLPKSKLTFFVFFDPDCEHCQKAIQQISKQYQSFKKTAVYLVSMENHEKIVKFMDTFGKDLKNQPNLLVLEDKNIQFLARFKPVRYPSMFLYSTEKKLVDYEDNPESVFRFTTAIKKQIN
jgi:thiol-disulfide isomerase/thioredoxin